MICKFCGNEIEDGSDFCFICGQKVEADTAAPAVAPEAPAQAEAEAAVAVAPVEEVAAEVEAAPEAPAVVLDPKAAKKAKAGKFTKFIAFLFAIIGLIMYNSAKKKGYEEKAIAILNAVMTGLNVKMVIVIGVLAKMFLIGK